MPYGNFVVLTGHITRDPEYKISDKGNGYTKFTLAVNRDYGDDKTDFIECTAFNRGNYKLAEYIANDITKGKLVTVYGKLHIDEWEKEGINMRTPDVIVDKAIYEKERENQKAEDYDKGIDEFDADDFDTPF